MADKETKSHSPLGNDHAGRLLRPWWIVWHMCTFGQHSQNSGVWNNQNKKRYNNKSKAEKRWGGPEGVGKRWWWSAITYTGGINMHTLIHSTCKCMHLLQRIKEYYIKRFCEIPQRKTEKKEQKSRNNCHCSWEEPRGRKTMRGREKTFPNRDWSWLPTEDNWESLQV